ncbi:MAG: hypothetical protein LBU04_00290 [Christensenellaceae bacterium]|jgi:hypothetical protein|nr:hypothetical protein [Christensenellaceae bacterium]
MRKPSNIIKTPIITVFLAIFISLLLLLFFVTVTTKVANAMTYYSATLQNEEASSLEITFDPSVVDDDGYYVSRYNGTYNTLDFQNVQAHYMGNEIGNLYDITIQYFAIDDGVVSNIVIQPINAGLYQIKFSYALSECFKYMKIARADPVIVVAGNSAVSSSTDFFVADYHGFNGFNNSSVRGVFDDLIAGASALTFNYNQPDGFGYGSNLTKPSVTQESHAYDVTILFEGDRNYNSATKTVQYTVNKTIVKAIASAVIYRYSGTTVEPMMGYLTTDTNLPISSTDCTFEVTYRDLTRSETLEHPPILAGEYAIENIAAKSTNYEMSTEYQDYKNVPIIISKQSLNIAIESKTIKQGEAPSFIFTYTGFVTGEGVTNINIESLSVIDTATGRPPILTVSGVYYIQGTGAQSNNYTISYRISSITVNKDSITTQIDGDTDNSAHLTGSFAPETAVTVSKYLHTSLDVSHITPLLKNANRIITKSDVEAIYKISFDSGGMDSGSQYQITLTGIKTSPFFSYKVALLDKNGNLYNIEKYSLREGNLTFSAYTDGYFIVYRSSLLTYVIIGSIMLIIFGIVGLKIATIISYHGMRRSLDESNEKDNKIKQNPISRKW